MVVDAAKVGLFNALHDYYTTTGTKNNGPLYFGWNPMALYARVRIPAKKLALVPLVSISNMSVAPAGSGIDSHNTVNTKTKKLKIFLKKPTLLGSSDDTSGAPAGIVHPFFWMAGSKKADDKKVANMAVCIHEHKGFKFPLYYNTKDISPHEQLFSLEPKVAKESELSLQAVSEPVTKAAKTSKMK